MRTSTIKWIINRSCTSKQNFTEEKANSFIDKMWEEQKLLLYYYKCPYCSSFHLTKNEPKNEIQLEII